jgi:hypothetical protein
MRQPITRFAIAGLIVAATGCDNGQANVLQGIPAMVYISRTMTGTGNVFDYTSGGKDANIFKLEPPTASGTKTNLTNWVGADIGSMDVSFDAREIAFAARAPGDDNFHIYRINVDGSNPCDADKGVHSVGACQVTMGANDETYPTYLPANRILYITNRCDDGPQHRDEYERATTGQVATMNRDGSNQARGPLNVSHRVSPTMLSDGRIMFSQWDHMGEKNEGNLMIMNQDMTRTREGFGKESKGITNAYLRAKEVTAGTVVAIGTSRDRTFQAGKIVLVNLGGTDVTQQSEARSSVIDLTPDVPGDGAPSFNGVGRYFDVIPVGDPAKKQYLVTWADGEVETAVLSMAKASPDFGIFVYDANTKTRFPIVNEVGTWEHTPLPLVARNEPPTLSGAFAAQGTDTSTLLSAVNVYDSTMFPNIPQGTVKRVRISEGFSAEEGFPNMFGLTEFDGMARLGEVDLAADNSFKALIPANTPVRIQLIDQYGMAVGTQGPGGDTASEPIWIQGRPKEGVVCLGCHEERTKTIELAAGATTLQAQGAAPFDYPGKARIDRKSDVYTAEQVMGVPWDKALQPIFDNKCTVCHDGKAGLANPSYTITDLTDMTTFSFTFNLTSTPVTVNTGEQMYTWTASHVSLLGPDMLFREKQIMVTMGMPKAYVVPGAAHNSIVIQMLNPPKRYPTLDLTDRAFGATKLPHPADVGTYNGVDGTAAQYQLTPDEYYLLELMCDSGGQFFTRENRPGSN